jgi:hypothetical protein
VSFSAPQSSRTRGHLRPGPRVEHHVRGFHAVVKDVSERLRAKRALQHSERMVKLIYDSSLDHPYADRRRESRKDANSGVRHRRDARKSSTGARPCQARHCWLLSRLRSGCRSPADSGGGESIDIPFCLELAQCHRCRLRRSLRSKKTRTVFMHRSRACRHHRSTGPNASLGALNRLNWLEIGRQWPAAVPSWLSSSCPTAHGTHCPWQPRRRFDAQAGLYWWPSTRVVVPSSAGWVAPRRAM